jgi:hypothetical protein
MVAAEQRERQQQREREQKQGQQAEEVLQHQPSGHMREIRNARLLRGLIIF